MADSSRFTAGLEPTLAVVSSLASRLRDDWWIIGSAAIALTGIAIEVPEVELLLSERDAGALLAGWAQPRPATEGQDRFRSIHGEHTATPIPIEIMGGLEVCTGGTWVPVTPGTRDRIELAGGAVYIPDAADQLALLLMFRRTRDLVRAEMLVR